MPRSRQEFELLTSQLKLKAKLSEIKVAQSLSLEHGKAMKKAFYYPLGVITCHQIRMMELTNGIGFKPRYFVTEISIENVESGLR